MCKVQSKTHNAKEFKARSKILLPHKNTGRFFSSFSFLSISFKCHLHLSSSNIISRFAKSLNWNPLIYQHSYGLINKDALGDTVRNRMDCNLFDCQKYIFYLYTFFHWQPNLVLKESESFKYSKKKEFRWNLYSNYKSLQCNVNTSYKKQGDHVPFSFF